jgi:2-polyprenyl-6-methoxyphenol hydroxylase-like FAD-dependent oxidoreductase
MAAPQDSPHALVLGASMAGMLAARALADRARVTIVERDPLPVAADARRGVPQAHHLHALLARGMTALESWFPGLRDEMEKGGGVIAENGRHIGWLGPFGWSPAHTGGLKTFWATRSFIDVHVRGRLRRDPRIAWMEEARVAGLTLDRSRRRVTGVRTEGGRTLEADLVVDATGRGSALPAWLREHGLATPRETIVDSGCVYASALVRLRRPMPNGWKTIFLLGAPPSVRSGAAMSMVEDERAMVTLVGLGGVEPPTDVPSALAYARALRSPVVADLLEDAEWLTPVRTTRSTANRRRHYESLPLPDGILAMGDALCAFNPVYGQGMTVAALQAEALSRLIAEPGARLGDASFVERAHRAFARVVEFPWMAATGEDFRLESTRGERTRSLRVMHAYLDRVFAAGVKDVDIARRLIRVFNLSTSPLALYSPIVVWAALRQPPPRPVLGPLPPPDHATLN